MIIIVILRIIYCLYVVCDECEDLHHGQCPVHGPLKQFDTSAGFDEPSKKFTDIPVPIGLTVKSSSIANAGLGVFATMHIPSRVRFGPYEGEYILESELTDSMDTSYMWEVCLH